MVCHSDHKYRLQRLLLVICQFSESERRGISDCERIFLRPCFEKTGRDLKCVSPHKTPSLTFYMRQSSQDSLILHFHSSHSLKCKESIVFSQALRYNLLITDDTLLQKELDSLAISLLTRQYPLEIITRNISKALLHSRETLLYRPPKTASPKRVLPIVTPYSPEGRYFSQSIRNRWHIIENESELQNVWSNHPITAYHKTKSLKDILVHSRQTKPISSRPVPTKFC